MGGYSGIPFQGYIFITKGEPLSPTILNIVVCAVLRHWLSVFSETEVETGPEGFGRDVQRMVAYVYAKDGLIVSTRLAGIKWSFYILTELFDWVGLFTNVGDMVSIV